MSAATQPFEVAMNETVHDTSDFAVVITTIPGNDPDDEPLPLYGIYNKVTGVREMETRTLAGALTVLDRSQAELDSVRRAFAAQENIEAANGEMAAALGAAVEADEEESDVPPPPEGAVH